MLKIKDTVCLSKIKLDTQALNYSINKLVRSSDCRIDTAAKDLSVQAPMQRYDAAISVRHFGKTFELNYVTNKCCNSLEHPKILYL